LPAHSFQIHNEGEARGTIPTINGSISYNIESNRARIKELKKMCRIFGRPMGFESMYDEQEEGSAVAAGLN